MTGPDQLRNPHNPAALQRGKAEVIEHPGGSVCAHKRWPDCLHADACWTTPKALCNIDAPIHPDDITTDNQKVTCPECREILSFVANHA